MEIMINAVLIAILLIVIGGAAVYVYKAKKGGKKCIGCPHADECGGPCNCHK